MLVVTPGILAECHRASLSNMVWIGFQLVDCRLVGRTESLDGNTNRFVNSFPQTALTGKFLRDGDCASGRSGTAVFVVVPNLRLFTLG